MINPTWITRVSSSLAGKVRVGFLALRDIPEGEELCYNYGDRSGGDWMRQGRLVEGRVVVRWWRRRWCLVVVRRWRRRWCLVVVRRWRRRLRHQRERSRSGTATTAHWNSVMRGDQWKRWLIIFTNFMAFMVRRLVGPLGRKRRPHQPRSVITSRRNDKRQGRRTSGRCLVSRLLRHELTRRRPPVS